MRQLQDRVCVVTGGGGSIGFASVQAFLAEGARVMLVDVARDNLDRCMAKLIADGVAADRVATQVADVGSASQTQGYLRATLERWGKIDVIFSNAGNAGSISPLAEFPEDVFDEVLRVHVRGAFLACKYGIPQMNDGGSVIITSSVVGLRGDPGPYAYITAKHAQVGLMRSVAKEAAARRIRVNTIHPGPTRNTFQNQIEQKLSTVLGRDAGSFFDDLIPLHRHAAPEEIARSVLFLASEQSSFITGSTLVVDGGMTA
jgi:NAD(P)-dependent dehydrogenase (short-subunit alcohol dehydrogenase family)